MGSSMMPCSTARPRLAQALPGSARLAASAAPQTARRRTLLRIAPQARRGSLDASLDDTTTANVAALEQLYMAAAIPPERLPMLSSSQDVQQLLSSGSQQPHPHHNEELCGKMVCVEHTIDDETGEPVADEAADPPPSPSLLGRLFDMLPVSKRTRGIVMLNLLVLLVATNWVSGRLRTAAAHTGGQRDAHLAACAALAAAAHPPGS